jgi:hypothetical protein
MTITAKKGGKRPILTDIIVNYIFHNVNVIRTSDHNIGWFTLKYTIYGWMTQKIFLPWEKKLLKKLNFLWHNYNRITQTSLFKKQEPVEPGDAPRIGYGHRKVYLL